jgi:hypothetical protein
MHLEQVFNRETGQSFKIYEHETSGLGWNAENACLLLICVAVAPECDGALPGQGKQPGRCALLPRRKGVVPGRLCGEGDFFGAGDAPPDGFFVHAKERGQPHAVLQDNDVSSTLLAFLRGQLRLGVPDQVR